MSSNPFDNLLEVNAVDDKIVVKLLSNRLDDLTSHAISGQLLRLVEHLDKPEMHLDLGNVEFIASTGLGLFVALHKKLRGVGRHLILFDVNTSLYEVFEVTHLHKVLDVRCKVAG